MMIDDRATFSSYVDADVMSHLARYLIKTFPSLQDKEQTDTMHVSR